MLLLLLFAVFFVCATATDVAAAASGCDDMIGKGRVKKNKHNKQMQPQPCITIPTIEIHKR